MAHGPDNDVIIDLANGYRRDDRGYRSAPCRMTLATEK